MEVPLVGHPDGGYSPRAWVSLHETALLVAFMAVLVWTAAAATVVRVRTRGANWVVVTATAITVASCAVASYSWFLVRWDQIALRSVTVGENHAGLWKAATLDDVRFLLVGGTEVSQRSYLVALLVHLAAPVVAALALAVSVLWAKRYRRPTGETRRQATALFAP